MSSEKAQTLDDAMVWLAQAGMGELVGKQGDEGVTAALPGILRLLETQVNAGRFRECLEAGCCLAAGELDRAHHLCQDIPGAHGAAWHAIVHRREGDFWNSKYWWRRAGGVKWEGLAARIAAEFSGGPAEVLGLARGGHYDAAGLVELVERQHERGSAAMKTALVAVQRMEWLSLFLECLPGARA